MADGSIMGFGPVVAMQFIDLPGIDLRTWTYIPRMMPVDSLMMFYGVKVHDARQVISVVYDTSIHDSELSIGVRWCRLCFVRVLVAVRSVISISPERFFRRG